MASSGLTMHPMWMFMGSKMRFKGLVYQGLEVVVCLEVYERFNQLAIVTVDMWYPRYNAEDVDACGGVCVYVYMYMHVFMVEMNEDADAVEQLR